MDTQVKASTNWTLSGGQDIIKAIKAIVTHEDVFIKPTLDEILSDDGAVLLSHPEHQSANIPCEFQIRVCPRFKIESLSLVCTAAKAELFIGQQKEYNETLYGSAIEEDDDNNTEDPDQTLNIGSYRYDIEINKSGIIEVTLKLLTNAREICIFGIVLNIAPNPNGITTLLPNAINLDNVQQMLNSSNSKLSPNAEKCKMFMQMYKTTCQPMDSTASQSAEHNTKLMEMLEQMMSNKSSNILTATNATLPIADEANTIKLDLVNILDDLKAYVDSRLNAFETKLLTQLTAYEASQSSKLDKILMHLENKP